MARPSVRAGYGIFYDHPLLAIAFNSVTADGGRSVQLLSAGGLASACGLVTGCAPAGCHCGGSLDIPTNLNGSTIFQGALNALRQACSISRTSNALILQSGSLFANQTPCLSANQNYLDRRLPASDSAVHLAGRRAISSTATRSR